MTFLVRELEEKNKESDDYAGVLQKENLFLRQEIERSKFSKDKDEYNRFLGGLA